MDVVLHPFSTAETNDSDTAVVTTAVTARHEDATTLIIVMSVCAVVAAMFVAVGAYLFIYVRRQRRKILQPTTHDERLFATLLRRSPVDVVSTSRQDRITTSLQTYNSCTHTIVTETPQRNNNYELENVNGRKRTGLLKFPSLEEPAEKPITPPLRSRSMGTLPTTSRECQHETGMLPKVGFSLKYKLRKIHLTLRSVFDLPVKTYGYEVYVVVQVFPRNSEGVQSRYVKGGKTVEFEENFLFDDLTLEECEKATLRIAVHYRKKTRTTKDGFLGELFLKGDDVDWDAEDPIQYELAVDKTRKKKTSTADKYLHTDLGRLFVCLEYQQLARRMKVMVRKAANLPKSDRLIGRPVHYVTINLMKGQEIVKCHETKQQSGQAPVWNQPFLFDLSGSDVNEYDFDFIIKRGKIHTKDTVVGHVIIGSSGPKGGHRHWQDMLSPRPLHIAKWHDIVPVLTFKPRVGLQETPAKSRNE